jgi:CheY-like chemotaxis protein
MCRRPSCSQETLCDSARRFMDPSVNVLLAEDNPDDAFLMQRAFESHGLMRPPHIVEDGAQAIAYLAGEGIYADRVTFPFPNLVILDLKMPRMNGFQVLEWIKEHPDFRVIPTIVWSSSSDQRDVKHAYCLGANGYLCKPTDFPEFKAMLGRLLAFWDDCLKPSMTPELPACDSLKQTHPFSAVR